MRAEPSPTASTTAERDDPAAIPLDYVAIPAGPNGSVLIAHDRHRLRQVAGRALIPARTLRVDARPGDASAVERIEAKAVRGLRRSGRHVRARLWVQVMAAVGLPFLVAALLGLVSVPIRNVPAVGASVADFLGSAGGSLGGLPLAVLISLLPSGWLIRRARGRVAAHPLARGAESALRVADLQVREDAGPFLAAADGLLADIGSLMGGRARVDGQRALRLATEVRPAEAIGGPLQPGRGAGLRGRPGRPVSPGRTSAAAPDSGAVRAAEFGAHRLDYVAVRPGLAVARAHIRDRSGDSAAGGAGGGRDVPGRRGLFG